MKRFPKFLTAFLITILAVSVSAIAQINNINTVDFPAVSFEWHEYSLEQRNKQDFSLEENNSSVDFEFVRLPKDNTGNRNKTILFLFEDMAVHANQYDVFKTILLSFFENSNTGGNDMFNVGYFNRQGNNNNVLNMLLPNFTSDRSLLIEEISAHKKSTALYSDTYRTRSDLFASIDEALDLLSREDEQNIKSVFVFTAGHNNLGSGGREVFPSEKALRLKIPVFVVQFYRDHGMATALSAQPRETLGDLIRIQSAEEAHSEINAWYGSLESRVQGFQYKFSYVSKHEKHDGAPLNLFLTVRNLERIKVDAFAPVFSLNLWIRENLALLIAALAALAAAIAIFVYLIVRNIRKQKAATEQIQLQADAANERAEAAKERAEAADAKAEEEKRIRERQEAQRIKNEQEEAVRKETERLENLMHTKNWFPRLQCTMGDERLSYMINKPVTTIGRRDDNDLTLQQATVSREHAKIIFNGAGFEIINLSQSNKIIVNGQFIEHAALKNGDIIGFGEVVITFFL